MIELERNPLAMRQGAAAVACIAAAAVAMPVIAHRAAEQRDGAEWAARTSAFHEVRQHLLYSNGADARVELVALRANDGLRARGVAPLSADALNSQALLIESVLRGPLAQKGQVKPAEDSLDPREVRCLSQAIYYEARGESYRGQVAVGEVVMNRVRSKAYPDDVCSVVYQGSNRVTGCQFTFTCDGALGHRARGRAWERAQRVATQILLGRTSPLTQRATHYHTFAVNPSWSASLVETVAIGSHQFYRFPNSVERARLTAARLAQGPAQAQATQAIDAVVETPVDAIAPQTSAPDTAAPDLAAQPQTEARVEHVEGAVAG